MTPRVLLELLKRVREHSLEPAAAAEELRHFPQKDLGFAKVDTHRQLRCGFPEVIFCQGKTTPQIRDIARVLLAGGGNLLATRAEKSAYTAIRKLDRRAKWHERARCVTVEQERPEPPPGEILIVTAGTGDIPVAEEARVTAEIMGQRVGALYDVGVAGIHRVLRETERLSRANVIVVAAGMEGALPGVVAALVRRPVVAIPTSIGYGASFGGVAPLLTMLNSCAAGLAVVNIDNGFGAGYLAALINRTRHETPAAPPARRSASRKR
ncbi:MAG: nickel pincer cofactor biosynthesis protein LarB [Planctomycetes bacterium]|nr:nickel pincer cofactor biosynthesis protein LarB [Planctomycetota bacterium]